MPAIEREVAAVQRENPILAFTFGHTDKRRARKIHGQVAAILLPG